MMRWIVLLLTWFALVSASQAGFNPDSSVHRFLTTLPYQAYYIVQPDPMPSWVRGWSFGVIRSEKCSNQLADNSCYLYLQSPIAFPEKKYLVYFPIANDSGPGPTYIDPSGVRYDLRGTSKPPAPTMEHVRPLNEVLDSYAHAVDDYREAAGHLRWVNAEAKISAALYVAFGIGAAFLIKSDNPDTRILGYALAGGLTIGFVFDARKYIEGGGWRRVSREARKKIESWDESTTRQLLDSLSTEASIPDSAGNRR